MPKEFFMIDGRSINTERNNEGLSLLYKALAKNHSCSAHQLILDTCSGTVAICYDSLSYSVGLKELVICQYAFIELHMDTFI